MQPEVKLLSVQRTKRETHDLCSHTQQQIRVDLRGWWGASVWCNVWTTGRCVWCFSLVSSILSQLPSVCSPGVLGIHSLRLQPRWALLYYMSAVLHSQEIREEKWGAQTQAHDFGHFNLKFTVYVLRRLGCPFKLSNRQVMKCWAYFPLAWWGVYWDDDFWYRK